MQSFSPEAAQRILNQLLGQYHTVTPREACGVILADSSVIQLRNWARAGRFHFTGFKLIWLLGWRAFRHGDGIAYIYHSHRESTRPSKTDLVFMNHLSHRWPGVGHVIFSPSGRMTFYPPGGPQ